MASAIQLEDINMQNLSNSEKNITIFRPVYTQHEFDTNHGGNYKEMTIKDNIFDIAKKLKAKYYGSKAAKKQMYAKLPFIKILMKYKWKNWTHLDIIGGLIVGTMQIPQSLAYAQLVGLKPIFGMYLAFFPVLIYFFLGTSKHISIGTVAIVSLLTGGFLQQTLIDFPLNSNNSLSNVTLTNPNDLIKASRVAGFTLCVGITQLIMGVFDLGFLTKYLSDPLISGFTVGSAIFVLVTQLKYCFGVTVKSYYGIFSVFNTIIAVCGQLHKTNLATFGMTIITITVLAVTKIVINPRLVKKIYVPIPIELLVVIAGTISSQYLSLKAKYNVSVVGSILPGIPPPTIPILTNLGRYIADIIITAIIAFSVSISLGKIFSKKHGYRLDPSQEFIAYGIMNIFSSFFYCYPSGGSVSRSAVQEAAGGKTQITSVISAILILFVLLFLGPLFEQLPNCILSSIIIVALKSMLIKFGDLKELWLFSIWDFSIWVITFLCTIIFDVQYGLIAGICLSIVSIVLRTQSPNSHILGQISGTDLYKNLAIYDDCTEISGIKIFRYEGSLYYACRDHFKKSMYTKLCYDPVQIKLKIEKLKKKIKKINKSLAVQETIELLTQKETSQKELDKLLFPDIHHIIIDCSTWGYIDIVGVKILHQVIQDYKNVSIKVLLANPKTGVRKMFNRLESTKLIDDEIIFVSVHDAVIYSLYDYKISEENLEKSFL